MKVPIIFLGVGNIGGTLLRQIVERGEEVARRTGLVLTPIALADVSGVLLDPDGLPEETLRAALDAIAGGGLLESTGAVRPLDEVNQALRPGAIVADMTATPKTMPTLLAAMETDCGIVLANKIPLATDWNTARAFFEYPNLRHECTVGAGLPVIDTLHYLLDTGDRITKIEGCLSGTLGYLCTELERGMPYSSAIAYARALGYAEPDPRSDLSGKDVMRKALILARTVGWPLEEADLSVESLFPESMANISAKEFMTLARTLDDAYTARVDAAKENGKVLRYVARVGPESSSVGLQEVAYDSPLGALRGPANYISLHTERYNKTPLTISGPGAGPEVTAAGVMGDIIKLASS
ncbi:MAG: homoserine dehydrogenase [Anaerolineae bacterium]|nr:homoserine dehydrogenase [Anaerolineae bacterium]